MDEDLFEIEIWHFRKQRGGHDLTGSETVFPPPSRDPVKETALLNQIDELADKHGFERSTSTRLNPTRPITETRKVGDVVEPLYELLLHITRYRTEIAYTAGAIVGLTQFVRNCLTIYKEASNLREGRSIVIKVRGEELEVANNAEVETVVRDIEKALERSGD